MVAVAKATQFICMPCCRVALVFGCVFAGWPLDLDRRHSSLWAGFRSARSALIIGRLLWIVSVPSGYSYLQAAIEETRHGNQSVRLSLAELMTGVIS
jgi:hypothetical protein